MGGIKRERLGQCVRKKEPKIMLSYKVEWHVTGFTFKLSNGISCDGLQLSVCLDCLCVFCCFVFIFHCF